MAALSDAGRIPVDGAGISIDWAVAGRSKIEGAPSGDGYLIRRAGACLVFAVTDGTGSGRRAARAAALCLTAVGAAAGAAVEDLFAAAHAALAGSVGAALALVAIDPAARRLSWAAVGDVDVLLQRDGSATHQSVIQRGGTLGFSLPSLPRQALTFGHGDVLVMVTDGIARGFRDRTLGGGVPEALAGAILADHGRVADDGLVLVARFDAAS